ncbi:YkgJ family cysteine cluster protein [Ewingella americana]|nr:YkgJ family cysteine cluster protein [Ewingella americana]
MRKVKPEDEIPVWILEPDAIAAKINYFDTKRTEAPDTKLAQQEMIEYVESLNNSSVDTDAWVAKTHQLADRFMVELKDYIVCRKGCAHCCKLPVGMTLFEASYIEGKTGRKYNRKAKEILNIQPNKHNTTVCPFLDTKTATCSIYEYRPLACRMFATIDDYHFCEDDTNTHAIVTTESSQAFQYSTATMIMAIKQNSKKHGKPLAAFSELRKWFTS